MPAQDEYNAEEIGERLGKWASRQLPGASDLEISNVRAPGATGFSSETMLVDAAWSEAGETREQGWVVRTVPTGYPVFPEYDLLKQYRCMQLVAEHSDVPVPRMRWYEADTDVLGQPFYVMDRVEAEVPPDNPPFTLTGFILDARPDQRASVWRGGIEALAGLHRIDWRATGFDFLDQPQFGATGLGQQFGYYDYYLGWAGGGKPNATIDAAFAWLKANRPAGSDRVVLNWGDARLSNIMYRDFQPVAVIDWEMATLGPPEVDLAWFLYLYRFFTEAVGAPPLEGFASYDDTVALYQELSGHEVHDVHYYEVWAGLRFAVIFIRLIQKMKMQGVLPDGWSETNNITTQLLASVAGLPEPV